MPTFQGLLYNEIRDPYQVFGIESGPKVLSMCYALLLRPIYTWYIILLSQKILLHKIGYSTDVFITIFTYASLNIENQYVETVCNV